jgi:ribosomal protein L16 Arg81 hydroxylase
MATRNIAPNITRILHPISVDRFVTEFFERKPLLIRGDSEKFAHLFQAPDFKQNLYDVTEIRAVFAGLWQATIEPGDLKEMIQAGASICITGMERAHDRLFAAAKAIKNELNYAGEVSFRAYLSPPGAGFDMHFDARVATTLQISGKKQWWYSTDVVEEFPMENSPREMRELKRKYRLPKKNAMRSVVLKPGDLLCLPAGTWHRARAVSTSLALNMAFDHFGAGTFDVVVAALRSILEKQSAWRAPLPCVAGSSQKLPDKVRNLLVQRLQQMGTALADLTEDDRTLTRVWQNSVE